MRILVVHNFYQQPGGEDQVFRDEAALLRQHGQDLLTLEFHNDAIAEMGAAGRLALARKTIWNNDSYKRTRESCQSFRPQVVHFHNTFPLVSPAGYAAARDAGAAVVQTLHNYRLICPAATLFRQGSVCEQCVGRTLPWPGVVHKCYRDSRSASAVTASMLAWHKLRGTYANAVDRFIALTEFARAKLIQGGLPAAKLLIKPNFVPDLAQGTGNGDFVLFVGRLVPEKGIATLLSAWSLARTGPLSRLKLRIMGDGPLAEQVRAAAAQNPQIVYDGRRTPQEVCDTLGLAQLLIFPSQWYEGLPRTIIEAYAKGTPVLASRLGSMIELVQEGQTGALFQPGDPADLIRQASRLVDNVAVLAELRRGARAAFLARYTADQNYRMLMAVYEQAMQASPFGSASGSSSGSSEGPQPAA
jgi:glycosyltransferase involved in cell wall biosynthesis